MYKKAWIAANIRRLVDTKRVKEAGTISALAKKAGLSKPTLTTFMNEPELRNISMDTLVACAHVLKVEPWMLLIPDFPFDAIKTLPVKKISASGYTLLDIYEQESDFVKYGMMEAVSHSLCKVDENRSHQIKEAQATYLVNRKKDD